MSSERAVKCLVQLHLLEVRWADPNGMAVRLDGPPVLVRVCLLGQLQHSHLHSPSFPARLEEEMTFERVVTNCRNPLLFGEVIRGEHMHIELIQLSRDYKGGKVIARHEGKTHHFLFPSSMQDGTQREVIMNRCRKYHNAPRLVFTTSTTLMEAVVHSPLDATFHCSSSGDDTGSSSRDTSAPPPLHQPDPLLHRHKLVGTDDLHPRHQPGAYIPDYSHMPRDRFGQISGESSSEEKQPPNMGITLPPSSSTPTGNDSSSSAASDMSSPVKVKFQPKPSTKFGTRIAPVTTATVARTNEDCCHGEHLKTSLPHCRHCCPSNSSQGACICQLVVATGNMSTMSLQEGTREMAHTNSTEKPFLCGKASESLLSCRDFPKLPKHKGRLKRNGLQKCLNAESSSGGASLTHLHSNKLTPSKQRLVLNDTSKSNEPTLSQLYRGYLHENSEEEQFDQSRNRKDTSSSPASPVLQHRLAALEPRPLVVQQSPTHTADHLIVMPGNKRVNVDSPSKIIQDKVDWMLRECRACQYDVTALGEDSPRQEADRLRTSMAAERQANLVASHPPQLNQSVPLGNGEYWSERMAQYTGQPHRAVFNETLEKIYNRLYSDTGTSVMTGHKYSS